MDKIEKFLDTLLSAVNYHGIYLWGGQGEKVLSLTEQDILDRETSKENAERVMRYIKFLDSCGWLTKKTRAFDCSGLVCYALVKAKIESKGFDDTADGLFNRYPHTVTLHEGSLLHRKGHIGVYMGYKHLIESKGRDYGVCVSPYYADDWDKEFANPYKAS